MDREDVERLVRVEEGVATLRGEFTQFRDATSTSLTSIDGKLDSLAGTRQASRAIWGTLVQLVPFVAIVISLFALNGAR